MCNSTRLLVLFSCAAEHCLPRHDPFTHVRRARLLTDFGEPFLSVSIVMMKIRRPWNKISLLPTEVKTRLRKAGRMKRKKGRPGRMNGRLKMKRTMKEGRRKPSSVRGRDAVVQRFVRSVRKKKSRLEATKR